MGHTVDDWRRGIWVSGAIVVIGILIAISGAPTAFGVVVMLFGGALLLYCFIGLGQAQKKIDQLQQAGRNFEARVQTDRSKSRW